MAIYRADKQHGIAWITGGSTGIGRELALDLAREGWTVAVTSRPDDPIEPVIEAAAGMPGKILPFYCDVTDQPGMEATVDAIEKEAGPIVLAVFNAGVYIPMHGEALDLANFRKTYEVNLFGVLHGLIPAVARMQRRTRGHIVLMGSVTAYFGWPSLAAYGATKAALNNMADALRYDFVKMNIRIQIINPGFVDTPLAAKNTHFTPYLMPVEKASRRMMKAIHSGGHETTFPWRLTWGLKFLRAWPHELLFAFMNYVTRWRGHPLMPGRKRE
jgi:NAD(P)-dependent dehydrogenase (short-subunit alcohol dehydrogenase family)